MSTYESECTGCGKPILWAYTEKGRRMPLDLDPVVDAAPGTYVVSGHQCRAASPKFDPPGTVYRMNHFATCPVADSFRSKR